MLGPTRTAKVTTFGLAMLTVAAIVSLRNLPLFAVYGLASIFYLSMSALCFLIPIAVISAELATTWPEAGGNYIWVSKAFGKRWGFIALWASWMESISWFPAILAFVAHMFAYVLKAYDPSLMTSVPFHLGVILLVFWGTTLLNFRGIETSSRLSSLGVILGTFIPGLLIAVLSLIWIYTQADPWRNFVGQSLLPSFQPHTLVLLGGMLLSFAGAELGAFHIQETSMPQKTYPKALMIAVVIILSVSIGGSLIIALVMPSTELNLVGGLIQAYEVFLKTFHLEKLVPLLALLLAVGSLAGINAWVLGPAKGMLVTAQDGFLPSWLARTNRYGTPSGLLILQASIGSLLSLAFVTWPETSMAYWILTALSVLFTVTQYALVLLAAWVLRYKAATRPRPFRVPGGRFGLPVMASLGLAACIFGFIIVFMPPEQLPKQNALHYALALGASFLLLLMPAVLLKPKA